MYMDVEEIIEIEAKEKAEVKNEEDANSEAEVGVETMTEAKVKH